MPPRRTYSRTTGLVGQGQFPAPLTSPTFDGFVDLSTTARERRLTSDALNSATTKAPIRDLRKSRKDAPDYSKFVHIVVDGGVEPTTFVVHESLITTRSLFFKSAMSGSWKEAQDRVVKLPDDSSETFQDYVHLLYTGHLAVMPNTDATDCCRKDEKFALAQLYVLADKLQDVQTKDIVVEAMLLSFRQHHDGGKDDCCGSTGLCIVRLVFDGTGGECQMRKLLVDIYAHRGKKKWFGNEDEDIPVDFLRDLAGQLLDTRGKQIDPTMTGDASKYMEGGK